MTKVYVIYIIVAKYRKAVTTDQRDQWRMLITKKGIAINIQSIHKLLRVDSGGI